MELKIIIITQPKYFYLKDLIIKIIFAIKEKKKSVIVVKWNVIMSTCLFLKINLR